MTTYRFFRAFLLAAIVAAGGGANLAFAQAPGARSAATPLPLAVELQKVPVGSWSEYRIADGQNNMNVRMALVARVGKTVDVETEIKGGPVAALGRTTMRMSIPVEDAAEVKPKEQVIQLGDNPPMFLPTELSGQQAQSFKKLDPKKRVGVDKITVPGGTFPAAEHYQDKGVNGESIDFWISKTILPFGLVKVTSTGGASGNVVAMELTGHGGGAKPVITRKPQAFDVSAIMRQAQPGMAGPAGVGGGAGSATVPSSGPPVRPVPSPHPGMPPTSRPSGPVAPPAAPAKDTKK